MVDGCQEAVVSGRGGTQGPCESGIIRGAGKPFLDIIIHPAVGVSDDFPAIVGRGVLGRLVIDEQKDPEHPSIGDNRVGDGHLHSCQ